MDQAVPMSHFMDSNSARGKGTVRTTRGSPSTNDAAIVVESVGALSGFEWIVAISRVLEVASEEIQVESTVVALAKVALHVVLVICSSPIGVDGPININQLVLESSTAEVLVENVHLCVDSVSLQVLCQSDARLLEQSLTYSEIAV